MYRASTEISMPLPLYAGRVPAGFPTPNDGDIEEKLDLNEHLIQHPAATFFVRVEGYSMQEEGIRPGDLLIIDRALIAKNGNIVLAVLDGEFTVKKLKNTDDGTWLLPANPSFDPIAITPECDFRIWGVVTHVIHACTP